VVPTLTVPNPIDLLLTDIPAVPDPLKETLCGLPLAPSVMMMLPIRKPVEVGVKVAFTVQLAPMAKLGPQLLL
jgi:hypothetical protein